MGKKITYAALVAKWEELNIAWNVTEELYDEMNTKSDATFWCVSHPDEKRWKAQLGVMKKGKNRCEQCKKANPAKPRTKEETDILLLSAGIKRIEITGEKGTKGKFQCLVDPDHTWEEATQQMTKREFGCYMCRGKTDNSKVFKLYEDDVLPKIQELGYTLLSKYEATDKVGEFCCSKGHTWKTHVGNVYRELSGCRDCSTSSCEAMSIFIMENLLGKRFRKTRQVLGNGLELDGYNEELKLAVEYNGSQHYIENTTHFHRTPGSFEKQLNRDRIKKAKCVEKVIDLITIPYKFDTFDKILTYINVELRRLGYDINDNLNWDDLKQSFRSNYNSIIEAFNNIKEIVKERNGTCISTNFIDRLHPMRFKCHVPEHPEFEKTPADIRRDVWCNECAHNAPQSTESINEEFKPHGIFLVSNYVPGSHTNQTFSCTKGHVIERQLDNMRRTVKIGKGCIICDNMVRRVPVYQYTLEGVYVATFATLSEVPNLSTASSVNIATFRNMVRQCMIDESKIAYDFIWSFLAPNDNKLVRFRNTRDAYCIDELAFIDKYKLLIAAPIKVKAIGASVTGATKRKNLSVIKFDLILKEVLDRFDSASKAIDAGNKKFTVYNNCAKFGQTKKAVDVSKCKIKQVFMYEDDNQLIPWHLEYVVLRKWVHKKPNDMCLDATNPTIVHLLKKLYPIEMQDELFYWENLYDNPNVMYLFKDYPERINYGALSDIADATPWLENHLDEVCWEFLSENPNAIHILEKNFHKIHWENICFNPNAIHLIQEYLHLDEINWDYLSWNVNAIPLLIDNIDRVNLEHFNSNLNATDYLESHPGLIIWRTFSANPNAIHIIEKNIDKVDWSSLSSNPNALHILKTNIDKIDWKALSTNPSAIDLIESNLDKVDWFGMMSNPNIVTYDYDRIKSDHLELNRELHEYFYHPRFIQKWLDEGNDAESYLM